MSNSAEYNSVYYAQHKQRIVEQRRARRLTLTEQDRERKRAYAREYAAKRRAQFTELVHMTNEIEELLESTSHDI